MSINVDYSVDYNYLGLRIHLLDMSAKNRRPPILPASRLSSFSHKVIENSGAIPHVTGPTHQIPRVDSHHDPQIRGAPNSTRSRP